MYIEKENDSEDQDIEVTHINARKDTFANPCSGKSFSNSPSFNVRNSNRIGMFNY